MKLVVFTLSLLFTLYLNVSAQVNVQLLHQLVGESKSEHERQETARNKQSVTTANEEVNRSQMGRLKVRYRELKNRFHTVGLAIDAAQIALEASPIVSEIIRQQELIFELANNHPLLVPLAIQAEADMAHRARMIAHYIVGLTVSIGDINQMKASDRKMLFGHALAELRLIEGASRGLAVSMQQAARKKSLNPFAGYINQDKRLVEEIMKNIDILKN